MTPFVLMLQEEAAAESGSVMDLWPWALVVVAAVLIYALLKKRGKK